MSDDETAGLKIEVGRLKKALEHERQKNRLLLQSMVDGVYTTDLEKRILFWNEGATRITGYTPEMAVGNSCQQLLGHTDESGTCLCDRACPLTGAMKEDASIIGKEVYSKTLPGKSLPVSVSCSPLRDENGEIVGAIEVFRDISEQKKVEEQKKQFFQMVTHDLKSPLTAIIGYTELLLDETRSLTPARLNEYLEIIKTSSGKMVEMISDFLDMSRLDVSTTTLEKEEFILSDLINRLVTELSGAADARKITITSDVETGIPPVKFDPHMIERAISNLVENAIKYTHEGGNVTVEASSSGDAVEISVTDDGHGVPEEHRDKIFDMYYRCEATAHIPGTGLGLPLVAAVARAHGGSVSVGDAEGGGSRFTLTLPAGSGSKKPSGKP